MLKSVFEENAQKPLYLISFLTRILGIAEFAEANSRRICQHAAMLEVGREVRNGFAKLYEEMLSKNIVLV